MTTTARTGTGPGPNAALLARAAEVDFPTLGHFLEQGFLDLSVQRLGLARRMIGIAATLALHEPDAATVNRAIVALRPGEVLVIDTGGDHTHAVVGAVTAAAARARGASGIVVDGAVTDIDALQDPRTGLPVHARGTTCLTTKRLDGERGHRQVPVEVGGARIEPGDVILGDANGVIALAPDTLAGVLHLTERSDRAEPGLLRRIGEGAPLDEILHLG
ncbi:MULTISPECIES: RraA family protein [Streptomyces]|uniref:RraA family protein n=1 Tax=Streptomyces TaxID=1883 RepID=UPI00143094E3|nr:RraA family protein [Streptomyces sp. 4R-3d]